MSWRDNAKLDTMSEPLIGKKIVGLDVSKYERAIRFRLEDGSTVIWDTEGDCCSESWWADATELNALRGGTVTKVVEVEMPYDLDGDGRSRQEVDALYGYKIYTDRGVSDLIFRNSSNGYYGGWAFLASEQLTEDQYGTPYKPRWEWREIEGSEWSA